MHAATALFLLGCSSVLGCASSLLRRPAPPPNLRPGWEVIKLGGRGKSGCMPYTVVDGDTCQSIAYQPDLAPDGTTVGPLFITRTKDGSLCRASAELAAGEKISICRFALQGTIGTFPPAGHSKNPPLAPPPLSGAGALSPCYNQLVVNGVQDAVGDGTYTDGVGALTQIGAGVRAWKAEVPGRQVLLLVNNVAFAPANASTAFASLAALSNSYSADGFAFGSFLGSDKGHLVGSGAALGALVNLIKDAAPWAFVAFTSNGDTKEYTAAWSVITDATKRVDTVGWATGEGEDARWQSYPEGGSSDGSAKRFPGNTWEHTSYYTYTWSWCYLGSGAGGGVGIGIGVWGAQNMYVRSLATSTFSSSNHSLTPRFHSLLYLLQHTRYGAFIDSVEMEYYGYSGTDEKSQPKCGPHAEQAAVTTATRVDGVLARPEWMRASSNLTAGGWNCGDVNAVTGAPVTGACRGSCCATDFAISKLGLSVATCKSL